MTFDELFTQVRLEVGPRDDTVELLLTMVEEGLNAYFHPDAAWKTEGVQRYPAARVYQEVVSTLAMGVVRIEDSDDEKLVKATAVAEGFRTILNRVRRLHLERQPITFPQPP